MMPTVQWHLRRNRSHHQTLLTIPTRQNPKLSCFGSKLGVLTAIESPCRALSIPANGIFYLIVVERAVAECLVTRAPKARRPTVGYREPYRKPFLGEVPESCTA